MRGHPSSIVKPSLLLGITSRQDRALDSDNEKLINT